VGAVRVTKRLVRRDLTNSWGLRALQLSIEWCRHGYHRI